MSIFISCILPEGLMEIPPVSNVTALPTNAEAGAAAVVAQHDEARLLMRALRHRLEAAHRAACDLVGPERLALETLDLADPPERVLGQRHRREVVGRQVLQVTRRVLVLGDDVGVADDL